MLHPLQCKSNFWKFFTLSTVQKKKNVCCPQLLHKRKAIITLLQISEEKGPIKIHLLQTQISYWEWSLVENPMGCYYSIAVTFVSIYLFLRFLYAKHCMHTWGKGWPLSSKKPIFNTNYHSNFNRLEEVRWEDTETETKVLNNMVVGDKTASSVQTEPRRRRPLA